jgi:hypothetical protein
MQKYQAYKQKKNKRVSDEYKYKFKESKLKHLIRKEVDSNNNYLEFYQQKKSNFEFE